jgi:hypothetical protein
MKMPEIPMLELQGVFNIIKEVVDRAVILGIYPKLGRQILF